MKMPAHLTKIVTSVALAGSLALAGCGAVNSSSADSPVTVSAGASTSTASSAASSTAALSGTAASTISYDTHFDADDLTWDTANETSIDLSNPTATEGVTLENGVLTISAAGDYRLSGSFEGQIVIAAGDEDIVRLILDDVSITNNSGAAIDAQSANELIIYTEAGTVNTLEDGSTYTATGEDDPDAALNASVDLTLAGEGTLKVTGNYADGIGTGDGLTIAGGTIEVTAADDGIKGKDYVDILGGTITVDAAQDGIKSTNDADAERGWVRLSEGTVSITAGDDGFKAERELEISGGQLTVAQSEEGIEAQHIIISGGTSTVTSNDDGINATVPSTESSSTSGGFGGGAEAVVDASISISGGELTLNVEGDGIDSNGTAEMTGGTVVVNGPSTGGNGALDSAGGLTVSGGTLATADAGDMFEGIDGTYIHLTGVSISAGDTVTVTDASGATVAEFTATKTTSAVTVAGSALTEGETYTVNIDGSQVGSTEATSGASGTGMGMFGGRP